jgi:UDP-N-acetylglucosamine transferase subunit ALG13/GT2 family glycosyltransferase
VDDNPLVLVSLGTDHHRFDRLIAWADAWAREHPSVAVLLQHGRSAAPQVCQGRDYLERDAVEDALRRAVVVVCHGGPATITEARRHGHLPIVVPRDPRLGEHVDDHQMRFTARLEESGLIRRATGEEQFHTTLDKAIAQPVDFRIDGVPGGASEAALRAGRLIDLLSPRPTHQPEPVHRSWDWPDVAVVVPTRDRPELLRRTLRSIAGQDYPGRIHTHVVFDGEEPDPTLASTDEDRGVSVVTNTRAPGLPGARNTGVLAAQAPYIAFCDDDDTWLPHKLRTQMAVMRDHPETDLVCCGIRVAYGAAESERTLDSSVVGYADLLRSRLTELHPSTYLFRRESLVERVGLVDEQIPGGYAEDYELLLRTARDGTVRNLADPAVRVLWHRRSHFAQRWRTIADALCWLLERYPEFRLIRPGYARIAGQVAFAEAACGHRAAALRWCAAALRHRPTEARALLAAAVAAGVPPGRILEVLHRRGKGL